MVLRLGNFKMTAVAMETAKTLTKVNNNLLRLKKFQNGHHCHGNYF
jgi:hypothetical protein